jgi:hypothetical protein
MKLRNVDVARLARRLNGATDADASRDRLHSRLGALIAQAELSTQDLAVVLNITAEAVINKLAGRRSWQIHDIRKLLAIISARLGRRVTFEDAFSLPRGARRARVPKPEGVNGAD